MAASFISQGSSKTRRLGATFAKALLQKAPRKRAFVIALKGELGSGKTTFVQGLAKALGVKRRAASPTFLLARAYPIRNGRTLYHIDCYRLSSPKDLVALGWRDWLKHSDHIIVVEWADKISRLLPRDAIHLYFSHRKKPNERVINIKIQNSTHSTSRGLMVSSAEPSKIKSQNYNSKFKIKTRRTFEF